MPVALGQGPHERLSTGTEPDGLQVLCAESLKIIQQLNTVLGQYGLCRCEA